MSSRLRSGMVSVQVVVVIRTGSFPRERGRARRLGTHFESSEYLFRCSSRSYKYSLVKYFHLHILYTIHRTLTVTRLIY